MKAKKYYQTPASRVIKVKVQQLLGDSPSTEPGGGSREQRSDWGED